MHRFKDTRLSSKRTDEIVASIVDRLAELGCHRTSTQEFLIRALLTHGRPLTIVQLAQSPYLAERNKSTIYRLVTMLEQAGIVHRVAVRGCGPHFELTKFLFEAGSSRLVCDICGKRTPFEPGGLLDPLKEKIETSFGWHKIGRSVEVSAVCPSCLNGT